MNLKESYNVQMGTGAKSSLTGGVSTTNREVFDEPTRAIAKGHRNE